MTHENEASETRRKLLRSLMAGSGVTITAHSLPEKWAKPIVNSIALPAHAETTADIEPDPDPDPVTGLTVTFEIA